MQLVIVESPAKAKTIEKYLGKDFKVLASYGHVRDLPPKDGSVKPDEDFAMEWELYRDKQSRFKEIADAAKGASRLVLATALIVLFMIDLEHQILPNLITLPGIVIGAGTVLNDTHIRQSIDAGI